MLPRLYRKTLSASGSDCQEQLLFFAYSAAVAVATRVAVWKESVPRLALAYSRLPKRRNRGGVVGVFGGMRRRHSLRHTYAVFLRACVPTPSGCHMPIKSPRRRHVGNMQLVSEILYLPTSCVLKGPASSTASALRLT